MRHTVLGEALVSSKACFRDVPEIQKVFVYFCNDYSYDDMLILMMMYDNRKVMVLNMYCMIENMRVYFAFE